MRKRFGLSRSSAALAMDVSQTVYYNLESGRSRIKLGIFFQLLSTLKVDLPSILSKCLAWDPSPNLKTPPSMDHGNAVKDDEPRSIRIPTLFEHTRKQLNFAQGDLARRLGYRSASMIHHFEKGIREPSLVDLIRLLHTANANLKSFVSELTADETLSRRFSTGSTKLDWTLYWSHFYISAIRQMMRTDSYRKTQDVGPGYFASRLGITQEEEDHAISVLRKFDLIREQHGKLVLNRHARLIKPNQIPRKTLDDLKRQWGEFALRRLAQDSGSLFSVDLLPVHRNAYESIVKKVRELQARIHHIPDAGSDGFAQIVWIADFISV